MKTRHSEIEELVRSVKRDSSIVEQRSKPRLNLLYKDCVHTVKVVRQLNLSKNDIALVEVIGNIGSPVANCCMLQLVELLWDLNWPVYLAAENSLAQFDPTGFENLADDLATDEKFRELDLLCLFIQRKKPELASRIRPFALEAMASLNEYRTDSSILRIIERDSKT